MGRVGKKIKKAIQVTDDFKNEEKIILRDHLAMERTKLANERTLLSYLRSALYLFLGGGALIGIEHPEFGNLKPIGYISFVVSLLFIFIGIFRFLQLKKHLKEFKANPMDHS